MGIEPRALLKRRFANRWPLFWLVSLPMSAVMIAAMGTVDLATGEGVSEMIGFSVRWAVPFIYVVVAISALQVLFPNDYTRWALRNRKYIGLCFAVAMAWQGLFIFMISNFQRDYYFDEIYLFRDELEGSIGYIFLSAMVLTSFQFGRRFLSPSQWRLLHLSGIYFLWAYPFSVYWWALSYYGNPGPIDYLFYWGGFLAFALRIAAWGKQNRRKADATTEAPSAARKVFGAAAVTLGLVASATGAYWQEPVTGFLTAPDWSAELVLWLPFWPFEPFLPLLMIGLGTALITKHSPAGEPAVAMNR